VEEKKLWNLNLLSVTRISKRIDGEEAKMIAWENMKKAKAEAAIQKLVLCLFLVSRRIFNSLRSGPGKMQVLHSTSTVNHGQHISGVSKQRHISNGLWMNASYVILSKDRGCVWLSSSACQPNR